MNLNKLPRQKAFTLIEILVAMAIFALVLAAIYATWIAILRSTKIGLSAAADVQRSRVAMQTIENALSCAEFFQANASHYAFVAENGDEATLSFVARLPNSFPRSGKFGGLDLRRVTFSLEPGPDSDKQLVLRQNPLLMDIDIDEQQHPVVLAKNIEKFTLGFWDEKREEWDDEWTQTNQFPPLIKISLDFGGASSGSQEQKAVTRIINIPSTMVQASWQMPRLAGGPPGMNLNNLRPGTVPQLRVDRCIHNPAVPCRLKGEAGHENCCSTSSSRNCAGNRHDYDCGPGGFGRCVRLHDESGNEIGAKCQSGDTVDLVGAFGSRVLPLGFGAGKLPL